MVSLATVATWFPETEIDNPKRRTRCDDYETIIAKVSYRAERLSNLPLCCRIQDFPHAWKSHFG